jgi:hypothetical protein
MGSPDLLREKGNAKPRLLQNLVWASIPLIFLLFFFVWPSGLGMLASAIWMIGGVSAFGVVIAYGYSNSVSLQTKEDALSFLLSDLLVLFFIVLFKPV